MKDFQNGETVFIIESDGIALGEYVEYSNKKQGHKVKTSTSSSDYSIIKDDLLYNSYRTAKSFFVDKSFRNKHFNIF